MEMGRRPARRYVLVCLRFLTNFVFSWCMLSGAVAVVCCRGCDDVSWRWAVPRPAPPRTTKYYYYILYLYTKYKPRRSNDTDYSRVASPVTRAGSSWSWWETRTPPVCFYFFDTVAHCPVTLLLPLRPFVRRRVVFYSLAVVVVFVDIVGPLFWSENRSAADLRGLPPSSSSSVWTCCTNGKRIFIVL